MANKILIVDDDPLAAKLMKLALTAEGYQVSTAPTAMEGLRMAQAERPDLILLDIMMPDMDGLQMCRVLRSQVVTADVPIIFLTGKTQVDDRIAGLRAGADDYISKPADPREVVVRVQAVLTRAQRTIAVKQGRVVAVIGAKGGVGTSTIAVNLAVALTRRQTSALLLDLRPNGGTIAWQLKLTARASLADLVGVPPDQIGSRIVEKALVSHSSGLRVLLSPPPSSGLVELPAEAVSSVVRASAPLADVVLMDLPHINSLATQAALKASDMTLLVLAPESLMVACAEQTLSLLESAGVTKEAVAIVLVNRAQSFTSLSVGDIERTLQRTSLGVMPPALEEVSVADRQGVPLVLSERQTVATMALREMAEHLYNRIAGRGAPEG